MAREEEEEGGGGGGGPGTARERRAMGINTNTAAPAGLPDSGQGSLVGTPPPPPKRLGGLEGELPASPAPASRVFLSGCRSGKEAVGLSKPGVAGPQGKSSRLAELPRFPVVPRAMPAQLALSSSRGTGWLRLPERAGRGARRCLGAAGRAPAASAPGSSRPPPGTCN